MIKNIENLLFKNDCVVFILCSFSNLKNRIFKLVLGYRVVKMSNKELHEQKVKNNAEPIVEIRPS